MFSLKRATTCIVVLILVVYSSTNVHAQLTIGNSYEPLDGALLDLKKSYSDRYNATSDKGLGLSRVQLTRKTELYPMFDSLNLPNDYNGLKISHKGLTVWNVNKAFGSGIGIYVWNGSEWVYNHAGSEGYNMRIKTGTFQEPHKEVDPNMYLPNCYMVYPIEGRKSQTFTFPVIKAYAVWENYKTPSLSQPFPNKTFNSGKCEAKLLWQDQPNLIKNISISSNAVDKNATITLTFDDMVSYGNALVALTIDGTIYWSWHIWYTAYNPMNIFVDGGYGEYSDYDGGGSVFYYNNGTPGGDYVFMDRNLGANANATNIDESFGYLYQWGRKDPICLYGDKAKIYDISGTQIINNNQTAVKPVPSGYVGNFNLVNTIYNPTIFYSSNDGYESWYTNLKKTNPMRDLNFALWDEDGHKTPFDPCPQGWRVPKILNRMPWFYQEAFNRRQGYMPNTDNYSGVYMEGKSYNKYGYSFKSDANYFIGFYPFQTSIIKDGTESTISNYYWVAQGDFFTMANISSQMPVLNIAYKFSKYVYFVNISQAYAASVRCVKDTNE